MRLEIYRDEVQKQAAVLNISMTDDQAQDFILKFRQEIERRIKDDVLNTISEFLQKG